MSKKSKLSCDKDDKNYEQLIRNLDKVKNYEKLKELFMSKTDLNFNRPVTIHIKNDWKIGQKLLLKNDYIGAENYFKNMLLMLCVDFNILKGLKFLLKNGANPSENLNDGSTVLTHALNQLKPNLGLIRALIQNGANIHDPTYLSNENEVLVSVPNVLFYAVENEQCYKKNIFKILFEAGIDPSVQDFCNQRVYYYAFQNYIKMMFNKLNTKVLNISYDEDGNLVLYSNINPFSMEVTTFRKEKTQALEYILENSQIHLNPIDKHPQTIYLKNWYKLYMFVDVLNIILRICKQTNVIVEEKIIYPYPLNLTLCLGSGHYHITDTIYPFSPIGMLINHIYNVYSYLQKYLLNVLKVMIENGFELSTQPLTISPLTLLFFQLLNKRFRQNGSRTQESTFKFYSSSDENELEEEKETKCGLVKLTQFFIDNNAHVNQSIVPFEKPQFETFRRDTFLPDAVYAAFESGSFMCFLLVLPYFAQPPLTLLLLTAPNWTALVNATFPILSEGGPIPPGSKYLKTLEKHLEFMNRRQAINHVYKKFLEMHSSPPTLMHLCRCVVRTSSADRASQPGESLPNLMYYLAPPGLRDFLTMPAPERLDLFYCEDPIMARIANEGVEEYPA